MGAGRGLPDWYWTLKDGMTTMPHSLPTSPSFEIDMSGLPTSPGKDSASIAKTHGFLRGDRIFSGRSDLFTG